MSGFLPIPDFAQGPAIPESGYLVTELGGGAYGITNGVINTMFLVTRNGVVVVDAPMDLGQILLTAIQEITPRPVTHLIYSHAHSDHIGAAHLVARDGVKILAHELTAQLVKEAHDSRRPLASEAFSGPRSELTIDGQRITLDYAGEWHSPGNLFIHLPEQKILIAIDTFAVKNAPSFRLLLSPHVPAYFHAMDQMLEYDFETVVSGHLSLFGTPEDVQTNREYIGDLRASVADALRAVDMRKTTAAAGVADNNPNAHLKVWMDAVTARAAELMPTSWNKRIGGNDIFLADNLSAVAWSLFLD